MDPSSILARLDALNSLLELNHRNDYILFTYHTTPVALAARVLKQRHAST